MMMMTANPQVDKRLEPAPGRGMPDGALWVNEGWQVEKTWTIFLFLEGNGLTHNSSRSSPRPFNL
jgi:hypothetical protein